MPNVRREFKRWYHITFPATCVSTAYTEPYVFCSTSTDTLGEAIPLNELHDIMLDYYTSDLARDIKITTMCRFPMQLLRCDDPRDVQFWKVYCQRRHSVYARFGHCSWFQTALLCGDH